ncbi:PKD-like family lipoprotein [Butyricimonas virosa]|nr:PKD-like family lipoprotein [Butyricimonas virosa]
MKTIIYQIVFFHLFTLFLGACYDDNGNYDYEEISKITVNGLEKSYSCVAFQDTLHLQPAVISSHVGDEIEYLWTLNPASGDEITLDTIGTERVLNFPVNISQGFYDIVLWITNKSNGVSEFHESSLNVVTQFSEGFYFLKDLGQVADIDLHRWDGTCIQNIMRKMEGKSLSGLPVSLGLDPGYCFLHPETVKYVTTKALTICTQNDVRILNIEDMSTIYTHATMFIGEKPDEKPVYIWRIFNGVGYVSDLGIYFSAQGSMFGSYGTGKFGYPVMLNAVEETRPTRHGICDASYYFFFDLLKDRFMYMDFNGTLYTFRDQPKNEEDKVPCLPSGINLDLKFFMRNYIGWKNTGFAIFEDRQIAGKHYLYTMALGEKPYNPIKKITEIPAIFKLNEAKLCVTDELNSKIIYFVTEDNVLYTYDPALSSEEVLSPEGFDGGEITYLGNRYWTQTNDNTHNFNYMVIATYKNNKYKVYMYETLGGKTYGKPKYVFEGDGKIVGVQYVSPYMNMQSGKFFPLSFDGERI